MPDWPDLRRALAAAGAAVVLGLAIAPAAAATGPGAAARTGASPAASLPPASVPGAPLPSGYRPAAAPSPSPQAIGGAQLAGHGVIVDYPSGSVPRLPNVPASAFVVADAGTGQVLAAKDPHGWYRPASTLKVLTAIALIPVLNPNATVVASEQATSTEANVAGLVTGRAYQISGLFTALLTISANDAAIALAQATGSFGKGMALINAEARHLQADDTTAVDPNGLDAPGQHASAYDLALIARQALRLPAFLKYDQTITARFVVARHKAETLFNQNSLLTTYPGALGGKIGWTSAAGATYIGMARRHGVTLIVTLLHCPALTEINSAEKLLDWGFSVDNKVTPVGTLVGPRQPPAKSPAGSRAGSRAGRPAATRAAEATAHPQRAASPSVLVAAGFSCAAVLVAGLGVAYTRRQRSRKAGKGNQASAAGAGSPRSTV
jgi:serine-type D-Ala-D-Ala carboxypeptidase (penicillin-binding protein 5/6)